MPITNFDKVELLLPMTGENNGTVFTDYSLRQRAVTLVGAPVTSTAQSKFSAYGSSGSFPTDSDYLTIPYDSGFAFGSGDFTIEAWARIATLDGTSGNAIFSISNTTDGSGGNFSVVLRVSGGQKTALQVSDNGTTQTNVIGATNVSSGAWHHFAGVRDGNTLRVFLNGVQDATGSFSSSLWASPTTVRAGAWNITPSGGLQGHMQDLCITKGAAKYSDNFTPPARMTQRELTRTNTGTDSHEYDRAVLFDWSGSQNSAGHTGGGFVLPDSEGDFVASDLIDLEYGVAFIKDGCGPICRGPVEVDPDA
jgi:hypothetical protein